MSDICFEVDYEYEYYENGTEFWKCQTCGKAEKSEEGLFRAHIAELKAELEKMRESIRLDLMTVQFAFGEKDYLNAKRLVDELTSQFEKPKQVGGNDE